MQTSQKRNSVTRLLCLIHFETLTRVRLVGRTAFIYESLLKKHIDAFCWACLLLKIYTMTQKFSNFFNPDFFYDHICARFLYAFHRSCFFTISLFMTILRAFLTSMVCLVTQFTCPSFHVHPMSSKFSLTDLYMYQDI